MDDTVLYLNEKDRYDDVTKLLDKWCEVSGANFNKEKTEIIPIGCKAHRTRVNCTCNYTQKTDQYKIMSASPKMGKQFAL